MITGVTMRLPIQPSRRFSSIVAVLVAAMVGGLFGASTATAAPVTSEPALDGKVVVVVTQNGTPTRQFNLSDATSKDLALMNSVDPSATSGIKSPGVISPQATVGVGWYIYVYLNAKDVKALLTGGAATAASMICSPGGPIASGACATVAGLIVLNLPTAPPAGYCVETRFSFPNIRHDGAKLVKRTC